jgi:hypothetical protein
MSRIAFRGASATLDGKYRRTPMPPISARTLCLILCLGVAAPAQAEVTTVKDAKTPNRVRPEIALVAANWLDLIPPGPRVNAPAFLQNPYAGQRISLALLTEGPDRERLLDGAELQVRISSVTRGVIEERRMKLRTKRAIKAEGADMVMQVLQAGQIADSDRAALEKNTSLVSLAIFQPDCTIPSVSAAEDIEIAATLTGGPAGTKLEPCRFKLRPTADWLQDPAPSMEEIGKGLNHFNGDLAPGRLLAMFKVVAEHASLNNPSIYGFFIAAFHRDQATREAVAAALPSLDPKTRIALLYVLRLGGQDIASLLKTLPPESTESLATVEPRPDPRHLPEFKDPVEVDAVAHVGVPMDECWAAWMATGDRSYLRALVGLLAGADDYPALQNFTKTKPGAKGLNAAVARGLQYQIAGWSIASFQRTDPLVADWLIFWQNDPEIPALIRKEIASLITNPAFRRQ